MQSIDAKSLSEKQRLALISLLADDDPAVYNLVRNKLLSYGSAAEEWLQSELLSSNPTMRRRAREIILHRTRERAHDTFASYCSRQGEDLDLEEATLFLARTRFPEINVDAYSALFDAWAQEIGDRFAKSSSATNYLEVFNHYLFQELGFGGHENYGTDPESCYINTIVDRRRGNPIGLCAIYLFLARRTGLPVTGIALPGHFICRYQSAHFETYVDCFRKGALLSKGDCVKYLLQTGQGILDGQLAPVSSRRILQRMCRNLVTTFGHLEQTEEATRAQRYLDALVS